MKNPIPLLSVALAFVIFGSTFIRNMTCPCTVAAILPILPTTSVNTVTSATETSKPILSKEILLNFKYNGKKVTSENSVAEIEEYLKTHENSKVVICGHADSRGSEAYNQTLSEIRAANVMKILLKKGVDAGKITTLGKGESEPISSNDTAVGRRQNRRVVIQIFG